MDKAIKEVYRQHPILRKIGKEVDYVEHVNLLLTQTILGKVLFHGSKTPLSSFKGDFMKTSPVYMTDDIFYAESFKEVKTGCILVGIYLCNDIYIEDKFKFTTPNSIPEHGYDPKIFKGSAHQVFIGRCFGTEYLTYACMNRFKLIVLGFKPDIFLFRKFMQKKRLERKKLKNKI